MFNVLFAFLVFLVIVLIITVSLLLKKLFTLDDQLSESLSIIEQYIDEIEDCKNVVVEVANTEIASYDPKVRLIATTITGLSKKMILIANKKHNFIIED